MTRVGRLATDIDDSYNLKDSLNLAFVKHGITDLGPGMRTVIWVQGCKKNCPGCVAPEHRPMDCGERKPCRELIEEIQCNGGHSLTISGGEPLLQWKGLKRVIDGMPGMRADGIILFTGYSVESDILPLMAADPDFSDFITSLKFVIDGEYIADLNDDRGLRGSSNQNLHMICDGKLYRYMGGDRWISSDGSVISAEEPLGFGSRLRTSSIEMDLESMTIVGIPDKSTFDLWKKLKDD